MKFCSSAVAAVLILGTTAAGVSAFTTPTIASTAPSSALVPRTKASSPSSFGYPSSSSSVLQVASSDISTEDEVGRPRKTREVRFIVVVVVVVVGRTIGVCGGEILQERNLSIHDIDLIHPFSLFHFFYSIH